MNGLILTNRGHQTTTKYIQYFKSLLHVLSRPEDNSTMDFFVALNLLWITLRLSNLLIRLLPQQLVVVISLDYIYVIRFSSSSWLRDPDNMRNILIDGVIFLLCKREGEVHMFRVVWNVHVRSPFPYQLGIFCYKCL
jgi:hypothetical protein